MGSLCPCLKSKTNQRQTAYDVHETFEREDQHVARHSGTDEHFTALVQEPHPSHKNFQNIGKQSKNYSKGVSTLQSIDLPSKEQQEVVGASNSGYTDSYSKSSTKSIIRKHFGGRTSSNQVDETLQGLERASKVITVVHHTNKEVSISGCRKSSIFVFDSTNQVTIRDCVDCLIFIAPCAGKIQVTGCKQMRMVLAARKVEIRSSKECDISLYCATPPILVASNEICFSNFLRVGYFDMAEQLSNHNLYVWNNRFQEVEDLDRNPEEEHYSMKKLHSFEIEWDRILIEGDIESGDPIVPLFWVEMDAKQKRQILVMNQPMREIQTKILKHIVSKNICILKAFKGVLSKAAFERTQNLFSHHEQNHYLCVMLGKELEASGFEAYFQKVAPRQTSEMEALLFPALANQ